ncbi:MAG: hypothetical protein JWO33_2874 [Caulobacteraceae bacterium]|nr:hypothetical protein [Caulobacteraceae bacterium]
MSQYFFHLRDGVDVLVDREGVELEGLAAVSALALREARSLISQDALTGSINLRQHLDVEDAGGTVIHRLQFEDAVSLVRSPPD